MNFLHVDDSDYMFFNLECSVENFFRLWIFILIFHSLCLLTFALFNLFSSSFGNLFLENINHLENGILVIYSYILLLWMCFQTISGIMCQWFHKWCHLAVFSAPFLDFVIQSIVILLDVMIFH